MNECISRQNGSYLVVCNYAPREDRIEAGPGSVGYPHLLAIEDVVLAVS